MWLEGLSCDSRVVLRIVQCIHVDYGGLVNVCHVLTKAGLIGKYDHIYRSSFSVTFTFAQSIQYGTLQMSCSIGILCLICPVQREKVGIPCAPNKGAKTVYNNTSSSIFTVVCSFFLRKNPFLLKTGTNPKP